MQLAEGHEAARDCERAKHDLEAEGRHVDSRKRRLRAVQRVLVVLDADERRRQRAEGVRDGRSLGNGRHRHPDRNRGADRPAHHQSNDDPGETDNVVMQERANRGGQHSGSGQPHAVAGLIGSGQPF